MPEGNITPAEFRLIEQARVEPALLIELARHRALEGEDRLLLVADGKDRALQRTAGPATGRELAGNPVDDIPLHRAGILRFIDQHMIDAEIELVENPGRRHVAKQFQRLFDQIVIVEEPAPLFLAPVTLADCLGDRHQRLRAFARRHRAAALQQGADALLLGDQPVEQVRMTFLDRLGGKSGAALEILGAENLQIGTDPRRFAGRGGNSWPCLGPLSSARGLASCYLDSCASAASSRSTPSSGLRGLSGWPAETNLPHTSGTVP